MIVLDTHALIWWVSDPKRVPARARRLIAAAVSEGEPVAVSSISLWEVAMLVARKRLALTIDTSAWIAHVEALPFLSFIPVDNQIAVRAVQLEDFPHRDPADRMIIATALGLGAPLVTADARIRAYRPLKTAWD
ncbi:MAG: type II toxin-antitoxin system VapC family toxin [Gemmatimonadales bacterium]